MNNFILVSLLLIVFGMTDCGVKTPLTHAQDNVLIQNFNAHEADFDRLAAMAQEDSKVVRITNDFTWLDNNLSWPRPESELGFSKHRWDRYRELLRETGVTKGINRTESDLGVIFFIVSANGSVSGGSEKGYAYSTKEPVKLVESLDNRNEKIDSFVPIYKKIKERWYLYYKQVN